MASSTSTSSKSVTFAKTASMRLALHVNNYTDDEYDACWFTPEDYQQFKKEIIRTARIMDNSNDRRLPKALCTRGVESKTKEGMKLRYKNVQTAKLAVLGEQMRQRIQSENNDNAVDVHDEQQQQIADLYSKYSESSTSVAYTKGLLDEFVAKEQEEDKTLSSSNQGPHDIAVQFMKFTTRSKNNHNHGKTVFHVRREMHNSAA